MKKSLVWGTAYQQGWLVSCVYICTHWFCCLQNLLVRGHFSTWTWTERRLIHVTRGHDCTSGSRLLVDGGELSSNNSFCLHPCTTGFAKTHMQCRSISGIFSIVNSPNTDLVVIFTCSRYTFAHSNTPSGFQMLCSDAIVIDAPGTRIQPNSIWWKYSAWSTTQSHQSQENTRKEIFSYSAAHISIIFKEDKKLFKIYHFLNIICVFDVLCSEKHYFQIPSIRGLIDSI